MSSYADAAASSGPIGAEKLPNPPQVKSTTNPHGNVETLPEEEFNKLKKESQEELKKLKKVANEAVGDFRKELDEIERQGESYYNKFIKYVKDTYNDLSSKVQTTSSKSIVEEIKNPVVITQALVGLGGLVAGYFTYLERHRIKSENKIVLATHASIITGLILVDGYLFKTYYPKYKKN